MSSVISGTKVKRYWPGKLPQWAALTTTSDATHDINDEPFFTSHDHQKYTAIVSKDDRRLLRLAEKVRRDDDDHRCIRQAEIVSTIQEEEAILQEGLDEFEEEDDDVIAERRIRIKEKFLQRVQDDDEVLPHEEEQEEEEEFENETYNSDDEELIRVTMLEKPVFVSRFERDTFVDRERIQAEEKAVEERMKRRLDELRHETKRLVIEEIKKDIQLDANVGDGDVDMDTDDDEINEAEEYEAWKVREITRIKRNRQDREALSKEKEDVKRMRNMAEEERREWERENPKQPSRSGSKKKWRFMQKYYHKGAFFQSSPDDDRAASNGTDDIFARDFSAPTGEDKMDKTMLPKVMQVKHFGRSGRIKWSHLAKEDTTYLNNNPLVHFPLYVFQGRNH